MNRITEIRKNLRFITIQKLTVVSILIGFLSAFLGISLKRITEYYETIFYSQIHTNSFYIIVFPFFGLSVIYFLRQYLFKKKENKGIREIFDSVQSKTKNLPLYKIPSHFINGLLTVAFGGSTGIEVSTVVATATIGSVAQQKENLFRKYKSELISAGVAAGITALFSSPIAGILFALEVISKKPSKTFFYTTIIAVLMAFGLVAVLKEKPLFALDVAVWHLHAIPYFILLGVLTAVHSVYLTKCVLFFKSRFARIEGHYYRILFGAALLSISLFIFPQLYGDGYHAMSGIIFPSEKILPTPLWALTMLRLILLKPVLTSVTLASGGDGGVFAPSLFMGAFLGLATATILNNFFHADVIPLNFIIIGMAATLSASIHAPFTALFLVCGLTNDYTLFFPILVICLISKHTAKLIYPFTVYTFAPQISK